MSFGSIIFVQFISVISPTSLSLMLSPRGSPVLSSFPWVPGSRGSNEVPVPAVRYSKTFIDASVEEVDSPLGDCSRRSCSAPPGRAEEPFLVSEEEYLNNLTEMLKDALNILKIWLKQNKHMAKVMNNDLLKSV